MYEAAPLVVEAPGDDAALIAAAEQAARHWTLPRPTLLRVGANAVFACGNVVLRVGRATAPMGSALRLAERLLAAGLRVAAPARADWLDVDDLSVTAWQRIDFDPAAAVDWERVGAMVAHVHGIDPYGVDHPLPYCGDFPWWQFDAMLAEADATAVDEVGDVARGALHAARRRHEWWIAECRARPPSLLHGDVHPGNVLVDAGGPVLIDWDLLCVGPREWDHAALRTWTSRWGGDIGVYTAFRSGYEAGGGGPTDEHLADAIAEMRLLAATLMRLRRARLDPAHAEEAFRRLEYWRGNPNAPQWRAQ